jgi:hypothetical protein
MILQDGTYDAVVKAGSPYTRNNGKLSFAAKCSVDEVDIVARIAIELNDGTISTRALDNLRAVFPEWDGTVEGLFRDEWFADKPCQIVVVNEPSPDNPSKTYSNVKWLNPPGGKGGASLPQKANAKELAARLGAKFRALGGGQPMQSASVMSPAAKPPSAPKAQAKSATSNMEACWAKLTQNHPMEANTLWDKILAKHAPGKEYADISPDVWSAIYADCADAIPF